MALKSALILGVDIKDFTNMLCQNLVVQNIAKIYDIRFMENCNFNLSILKNVTYEGSKIYFCTFCYGSLVPKYLEVDNKKVLKMDSQTNFM